MSYPAPRPPESIRAEARALLSSLAAVAGDEAAVCEIVADFCREIGRDEAPGVLAGVAIVLFSECIKTTTNPGQFADVELPTPTEGHPC